MSNKKQINIFIIEDSKLSTLALKADIETTFPKTPITLHSFETAEMCKERFKESNPQIVITDYHLNSKFPGAIDGIQLLDWVKKENSETSVILLTSDDDINVALKAFLHESSDFGII